MPEQTKLRPTGRDEFRWYILGLEVKQQNIWCGNCAIRIPVGATHARCPDDGDRLCADCVEASERGPTLTVTIANRRQRHEKIQAAINRGGQMLLDGLEVESIGELKALVDAARSPMWRHTEDRAAKMSTAIGIARAALDRGDPEAAKRELDDACDELHRMLFDALVAEGHDPAQVEGLVGPRERTANGD